MANVYLDEALIGAFSLSGSAYQVFTVSVATTQGAHRLMFRGMASSDSTLLLDRVVLTLP